MLSARAYSFRKKSRLAISLSWIGGYTNVVSLLACGTVVSHVTGTVTNIGRYIVTGQFAGLILLVVLVISFGVGAVISAVLTESARHQGNRSKYVLPIAVELVLLAVFGLEYDALRGADLSAHPGWRYLLIALPSMAMGIQNATITKISGSVVRTTHLTGVLTDLSLEGVQFLFWWKENMKGHWTGRAGRMLTVSQRHPTVLRLLLLFSIFGSYLAGTVMGTAVFLWKPDVMMFPVVLFLGFIIMVDLRRPIADVRELDLLSDLELQTHGIVKAMLPPQIGIFRSTCLYGDRDHRSPNFQLWVDRLPKHLKVVILAINSSMRVDANAVMDLELAMHRLHDSHRKLIISGVTVPQFKSLNKLCVDHVMDVSNMCPDLEFAIARAISVRERMLAAESFHVHSSDAEDLALVGRGDTL